MRHVFAWPLAALLSQLPNVAHAQLAPSLLDALNAGQTVQVDAGRVNIDISPAPYTVSLSDSNTWSQQDRLPSGLLTNGLRYNLNSRVAVDGRSGMAQGAQLDVRLPQLRFFADEGWRIDRVTLTITGRAGVNAYGSANVYMAIGENWNDPAPPITPGSISQGRAFSISQDWVVGSDYFDQYQSGPISAYLHADYRAFCRTYDQTGSFCVNNEVQVGEAWLEFNTLSIQASVVQVASQVPEPQSHLLAALGLAAVVALGRKRLPA